MTLRFTWDEAKADSNWRRHGVEFEEAITIFGDYNSLTIFDEEHSAEEERFIEIGLSAKGRLLVVVYTERGSVIRIISSREASPREREEYERHAE